MRGVLLAPKTPRAQDFRSPIILDPVEALSHRPGGHRILADLNRSAECAGPFEPRGSLNSWEETLRSEIASATVINTSVAETILVPDVVLPARYLMSSSRTLRATVRGVYGTTATPTMIVRLRIGGVAGILIVASATFTMPSTVTTVPFKIEITATVRSEGAAGTMFGQGEMIWSTAAPNTAVPQFLPGSAPAVSGAIDQTAQQNFSVTVQWGTSSASNTVQAHMYQLESMN